MSLSMPGGLHFQPKDGPALHLRPSDWLGIALWASNASLYLDLSPQRRLYKLHDLVSSCFLDVIDAGKLDEPQKRLARNMAVHAISSNEPVWAAKIIIAYANGILPDLQRNYSMFCMRSAQESTLLISLARLVRDNVVAMASAFDAVGRLQFSKEEHVLFSDFAPTFDYLGRQFLKDKEAHDDLYAAIQFQLSFNRLALRAQSSLSEKALLSEFFEYCTRSGELIDESLGALVLQELKELGPQQAKDDANADLQLGFAPSL